MGAIVISKSAKAGEMRTKIRILAPEYDETNKSKYRNPTYHNIYPDGRKISCKWVSAFGVEAVQAQSLGLTDPATITLRYDPRITSTCVIVKGEGESAKWYEIISPPNDVGDAHRWMEIKVKGRARAL